jgi:hypothetical protein
MAESEIKRANPQNIYTEFVNPGSKVPTADEIFLLPTAFIECLREIFPKIKDSGVWWAIGGELSEKLANVNLVPKEIEILTNEEGVGPLVRALASYGPTPISLVEYRLDREAEIDSKKYPVLIRSQRSEFSLKGVKVIIHGNYQIKVGEWDWGDSLEFKPAIANMVGMELNVMPVRLSSELYLTLGWLDRTEMISKAISAAHHAMGQYGNELGGGYGSE